MDRRIESGEDEGIHGSILDRSKDTLISCKLTRYAEKLTVKPRLRISHVDRYINTSSFVISNGSAQAEGNARALSTGRDLTRDLRSYATARFPIRRRMEEKRTRGRRSASLRMDDMSVVRVKR